MDKLQWSPALDVYDEQLNQEHKHLIEMMEKVYEVNQRSPDKASLLKAFQGLLKLTKKHFVDEEHFMAEHNYPELEQHRLIHQQLIDALFTYQHELEKSVHVRFPASVFDFFKTWITTHIMLVDKRYADFVNQQKSLHK